MRNSAFLINILCVLAEIRSPSRIGSKLFTTHLPLVEKRAKAECIIFYTSILRTEQIKFSNFFVKLYKREKVDG